jgi:cell division protein FtsQ
VKSRVARKRRRTSPVARLRPFWFLLVLLIGFAGIGAYVLMSWPALDPHSVDVLGNHVVSRNAIVQRARIDLARNMWLQNTQAMALRIAAIPYIDTAVVRRHVPDRIAIGVTERTPYAFIGVRGAGVTVDRALRVLQLGEPPELAGTLPVLSVALPQQPEPGSFIAASAVTALQNDAAALIAARLDPAVLAFDRFGDVVVTLRGGVRVLLGDQRSVAQKVPLIEPILQQVGRGTRKIVAIDLRAYTTPVVVYAK